MAGETILIVEDNRVNQKLLLTVLRPHHYRLLTAADGEEALAVARRERPDLILMDLQLPKINGYQVTRMLQAQAETRAIPVVALTAHAMPDKREYGRQVGFLAYITKPIDTRAFPQQVRQLLDRAKG